MSGTSNYVPSMTYDIAGRLLTRALGNGLTQNYTYYPWNQQGGRLKILSTGTLQNLTYQYDAVGNITQIADSVAGETSVYDYDALDRLTSWTLNQNSPETYTYDAQGNLDVKNGMNLNYNDAAHKHAVTHIGSTQKYWYDDNGNQTTRIVGADTFNLIYDAENRLVEVKKNSATISQFTYDGDGARVKSVIKGETIRFVGGYYERKGSEITKYYMAGATRVAMRKYTIPQSMTVEYMLGDHLGSTSITTDSNGALISEIRYKPWGETRYTSTEAPANTSPTYELTRYQYTGQYSYDVEFGLKYYGARFYDSAAGRFVSGDTIISGGTQGYDRYAYSRNNPVRYKDPSGHCAVAMDSLGGCSGSNWNGVGGSGGGSSSGSGGNNPPPAPPANPSEDQIREYIQWFGLTLVGNWSGSLLLNLWTALNIIGFRNIRFWLNGKIAILNDVGANDTEEGHYWGFTHDVNQIDFHHANGVNNSVMNILHEFGHLVDNLWGDYFTKNLKNETFRNNFGTEFGSNGSGVYSSLPRNSGLISTTAYGDDVWQQLESSAYSYPCHEECEDWADIFANAMVGNVNEADAIGGQMSSFYYQMESVVYGGLR